MLKKIIKEYNEQKNEILKNLNNIYYKLASEMENVPLEEFESLNLNELYNLFYSMPFLTQDKVDNIIKIIEQKKIDYRKQVGFGVFTKLNYLEYSKELKYQIEDKLLNYKSNMNVNYFLDLKLNNDYELNKKVWLEILDSICKFNYGSIKYNIYCPNCTEKTILFSLNHNSKFTDYIVRDIMKCYHNIINLKTNSKEYQNGMIFIRNKLESIPNNLIDFQCEECCEEVDILNILSQMDKLFENPSLCIYQSASNNFFPIKEHKVYNDIYEHK